MKPGTSSAAEPRSSACRSPGWRRSFLLPFLVVAKISVSEMETTTISDIVAWKDGAIAFSLKFGNYLLLAQDSLYFNTYLASLKYAAVTTLLCLVIGYPFAYSWRAPGGPCSRPADAGDAAVLDLVPAARLRLEGPAHRHGLVADAIERVGLDRLLAALGLIPGPANS